MASKKTKAAKSAASGAAGAANTVRQNEYIQRLIEDADLRENLQKAVNSGKSAAARLSNGKAPHRAVLEDKKLQKDLREAYEAVREVSATLTDAPRKRAKKGLHLGRRLLIVGVGSGLALAGSEQLRSKVLDALFGKEEEFQYTPPAGTTPPATAGTGTGTGTGTAPVSAA